MIDSHAWMQKEDEKILTLNEVILAIPAEVH